MEAPIAPYEKPVVVMLLVDELSKSKSEVEVLELTGSVLDVPGRLDDGRKYVVLPLFTSVSETVIRSASKKSQRVIVPLPMAVSLTSAPAYLLTKLNMPPAFECLIEMLCRDVGYHGRMLEAIASILEAETVLRDEVLAQSDRPFCKLSAIHGFLFSDPLSKSFFVQLNDERKHLSKAVCFALLGMSAPINEPCTALGASTLTFDDLLSMGVFISNADATSENITPVMSPLQLVKWASRRKSDGDFDLQTRFLLDAIIKAFGSESSQNWETFERFNHSTMPRFP